MTARHLKLSVNSSAANADRFCCSDQAGDTEFDEPVWSDWRVWIVGAIVFGSTFGASFIADLCAFVP